MKCEWKSSDSKIIIIKSLAWHNLWQRVSTPKQTNNISHNNHFYINNNLKYFNSFAFTSKEREDLGSRESDKYSMNDSDTVEEMTAMNYYWMTPPTLNQRAHVCSTSDLVHAHSPHAHTTSFTATQEMTGEYWLQW